MKATTAWLAFSPARVCKRIPSNKEGDVTRTFWRTAAIGAAAFILCGSTFARAQALTWDNVHINVTDPAKAAEWYVKYLGGTLVGAPGQGTQAMFGNVVVVFLKGQEPQTSA